MTNGWSNRETWLVVVHFSHLVDEGGSWDGIKEYIQETWEAFIKHRVYDGFSGEGSFFNDYINFGLINWDEIKKSAYGDEEE